MILTNKMLYECVSMVFTYGTDSLMENPFQMITQMGLRIEYNYLSDESAPHNAPRVKIKLYRGKHPLYPDICGKKGIPIVVYADKNQIPSPPNQNDIPKKWKKIDVGIRRLIVEFISENRDFIIKNAREVSTGGIPDIEGSNKLAAEYLKKHPKYQLLK